MIQQHSDVRPWLIYEIFGMVAARVVKRSLGPDGNAVGAFNHNKMLDTRIYDIMFMDGTVQQLAANRIALSMYKHVDLERLARRDMIS